MHGRFVLANRFIGDIAPRQLYSSAIVFAQQTSVVRKFVAKYQHGLSNAPITPVKWGLELQKLEGHDSDVNAVAFSHDGSLLASASGDRTGRLWNPTTGQDVQALKGHTEWVNAVAFSHDGSLLASASGDWTVRLWNPRPVKNCKDWMVSNQLMRLVLR
jgi:WD40 repeat protein